MQSTVEFTIPNAEFLVTVHGSRQNTACSPRLEQVQRADDAHQVHRNDLIEEQSAATFDVVEIKNAGMLTGRITTLPSPLIFSKDDVSIHRPLF